MLGAIGKSVLKIKTIKPPQLRLKKLLLIHRRHDAFKNCSQHTSVLHDRFIPMRMGRAKGDKVG